MKQAVLIFCPILWGHPHHGMFRVHIQVHPRPSNALRFSLFASGTIFDVGMAKRMPQMSKGVTMNRLYLVVCFAFLLFALGGGVLAGSGNGNTEDSDRVTSENVMQFKPHNKYELLSHSVDLWHDAMLKGDERKTKECRQAIQKFLEEDIESNRSLVKMLTQQVVVNSAVESNQGKNLVEQKPKTKLSKADRELIGRLGNLIKTKELLIEAMRRTEAFSNQYRLLGDYLDLLRKELDMPRLQYAVQKLSHE